MSIRWWNNYIFWQKCLKRSCVYVQFDRAVIPLVYIHTYYTYDKHKGTAHRTQSHINLSISYNHSLSEQIILRVPLPIRKIIVSLSSPNEYISGSSLIFSVFSNSVRFFVAPLRKIDYCNERRKCSIQKLWWCDNRFTRRWCCDDNLFGNIDYNRAIFN